jgi:hypothetical protein
LVAIVRGTVLQDTLNSSNFGSVVVSMLASLAQVREFKPDRKPSDFSGEKIVNMPSYGWEVNRVLHIAALRHVKGPYNYV